MCQGCLETNASIGGATDDFNGTLAGCYFTDTQLVGVGVLLGSDNLRNNHAAEWLGDPGNAIDFEARHGELMCKGLGAQVWVDPFTQPGF